MEGQFPVRVPAGEMILNQRQYLFQVFPVQIVKPAEYAAQLPDGFAVKKFFIFRR